jgi:hypothetical protein
MEKHGDPISFVLNSINTLPHPVFANQADAVTGGQAKEDFTQHGLIFVFLAIPNKRIKLIKPPSQMQKTKKMQKTKRARLNKRHHCWFRLSSRARKRGTTRYSIGEYLIKNDGCCQPPNRSQIKGKSG